MTLCLVILAVFAGYWAGRYERSPKVSVVQPELESDEGTVEWQHDGCGADIDHDAEFCHACGMEIDTFTDSEGVEHDGLPMWKLGEN